MTEIFNHSKFNQSFIQSLSDKPDIMIKIILCDDHEIVRKGLFQILQEHPDFKVLADVSSGEMLFRKLRRLKPDVIVLDIALPGRSGLEVLKQVRLLYPEVKALVLSMYPEDQFAIRMIKAGASGYLHKDSAPSILHAAIKTVAVGGKYASPAVMNILFKEVLSGRTDFSMHQLLSDREMEVLIQLGRGKKTTEIAQSMSLSIKTISTYKTRVFEKLNIKNPAQVARFLMEHDLMQGVYE